MGANDFVIGVQTKVYFGIMPAETLALETPTAPPDALVTMGAVANANAGSLTVSALPAPIPAGTTLAFAPAVVVDPTADAAANATSLTVTALSAGIPIGSIIYFKFGRQRVKTTAAAASGATTISVEPLKEAIVGTESGYYFSAAFTYAITSASAATGATTIAVKPVAVQIPNGAIALHQGLVLLQGGTSSEESISADDTETQVYGEGLTYSTGVVTGAGWEVSYEFNVLPTDPGYGRLAYAAQQAIGGVYGWVRKVDPTPAGKTSGETIEGLVQITDFSKSNPAGDIITGSLTFKGRGTPTLAQAA